MAPWVEPGATAQYESLFVPRLLKGDQSARKDFVDDMIGALLEAKHGNAAKSLLPTLLALAACGLVVGACGSSAPKDATGRQAEPPAATADTGAGAPGGSTAEEGAAPAGTEAPPAAEAGAAAGAAATGSPAGAAATATPGGSAPKEASAASGSGGQSTAKPGSKTAAGGGSSGSGGTSSGSASTGGGVAPEPLI